MDVPSALLLRRPSFFPARMVQVGPCHKSDTVPTIVYWKTTSLFLETKVEISSLDDQIVDEPPYEGQGQ